MPRPDIRPARAHDADDFRAGRRRESPDLGAWLAANEHRVRAVLARLLGVRPRDVEARLGIDELALRQPAPEPQPNRRPRGRPRRGDINREAVLDAMRRLGSVRAAAAELGVPRVTLARHVAALPAHAWIYGADLREEHGAILAASAVRPDVAAARGYRSVADGLRVPLWNVCGRSPWWQVRLDVPTRSGRRRRRQRYRNGRGAAPIVDVPPAGRALVLDRARQLYVTESPRKADAAVSQGLACVAIAGALMVCEDLEQWEQIGVRGRDVVLVFDADVETKPEVGEAERRLLAILRECGANVRAARLPHSHGLDDFLAAGGDVALL